jgi:hypothetical protein
MAQRHKQGSVSGKYAQEALQAWQIDFLHLVIDEEFCGTYHLEVE